MFPLWFLIFSGLLIGLILGSFTTMLSYRVPKRLSIVKPGSHCPKCKTPLKPIDLMPVFSFLAYGGKCRYCGVKIGTRYLFIELAVTASTIFAFIMIGIEPALVLALFAIVAVVTLIATQIEKSRR